MRMDRFARVSIISILVVFSLLFLFLTSADGITGNATAEMPPSDIYADQVSETNSSVIIESSADAISLDDDPLLSLTELSQSERSASTSLLADWQSEPIPYQQEQDGGITYLYPSLIFDSLDFSSVSGTIFIDELGRVEEGHTFINAFVIDTAQSDFTDGSFTKRVEGTELYRCDNWDGSCRSGWIFVKDISGDSYRQPLDKGIIAYGEVYEEPSSLDITSVSSSSMIQSAISATQADGLIAYGELRISSQKSHSLNLLCG